MKKKSSIDWKTYEHQVFELFKQHFPAAKLQKNIRIKGRFSKRKRQIDLLIRESTPAGILKTIVDAKFFKRKVDVKAVDALAGFVDDVGAQRGMLITSIGYTKAALRRAYYGPSNLELDILNFSALHELQGFTAVPYKGKNAFLVSAPFGWIVDAKRTDRRLANMYQRGIDLSAAIKRKEFLYINYWDRRTDSMTAAKLDKQQIAQMKFSLGSVRISHRSTIQRADAISRLRVAEIARYKCLEITGFLEFNDVIFFAVLLTPKETQRSNIRRLESVMSQAIPIQLKRDNTALIGKIQGKLEGQLTTTERATLLCEAGYWYRDMDKLPEAKQLLEESLALEPRGSSGYRTMNELLAVLAELRDEVRALEIMEHLLRLDPHNPTVFNDCFKFAADWIERPKVLTIIDALKAELPKDQLIQANCDFYAGNILMCDDFVLAKRRFTAAHHIFRQLLPKDHQIFNALRLVFKQLNDRKLIQKRARKSN